MGKGVAEIAALLSFPELFLILRRAERRRIDNLHIEAVAGILAACAPWNEKSARRANEFVQSLAPSEPVDEKRSAGELTRLLGQAGIPIKKE